MKKNYARDIFLLFDNFNISEETKGNKNSLLKRNSGFSRMNDFELVESEEEHLVSKILMLSGVITKQPDLNQGAMTILQLKNKEWNF